MIDFVFKTIWHYKIRSLLTVLGVGLAVTLYVYLSTIMSFYDRDLERTVASFAGKVVVQSSAEETVRFPPMESLIPASSADEVLRLPDVDPERSSAVLFESVVSNPAPNMPPSVMAVGVSPGRESAFIGSTSSGSVMLESNSDVFLGAGAAGHYGVMPGEWITIKGRELRVAGILDSDTEVVNNSVLMPLQTAQDLFARPDTVSGVMITARTAESIPELIAEIDSSFPGLVASSSDQLAQQANELLGPQRTFFATVRGTIIAAGAVMIMVVMIMAVGERKREIGTLKALGAPGRKIVSLVLCESVTLSLLGGVGAILLTWFLTFGDDMSVDLWLALQAIVISTLVGSLAALWPAWSALRVDPVESLRHE